MLRITVIDHYATREVRVSSTDQDIFYLVVNDLKQKISAIYRNFNPTWKSWFIRWEADDALCRWIEQARQTFGATVEGDRGPWSESSWDPPPRQSNDEEKAFEALRLLPSAPPALIKQAYRTLATLHHPDRGGSDEEMKRLNNALDVLRPKLAA